MADGVVDRVSDAQLVAMLADGGVPVLVDFYADWCGPCKQVAPVVAQIAAETAGRLRVVKVDVDSDPLVAAEHRVTGIPTLLLFVGGDPVLRVTGAQPYRVLAAKVLDVLPD